jgi:uncharacterized protein
MPTLQNARLWYSVDDPVHGFDHVQRVYRLAETIALSEGADLEIVRAAVLLHDVDVDSISESDFQNSEKAGNRRENHQHSSADFAQQILSQEGWVEGRISAVRHCILSHRFRDRDRQPQTLEARVLFDADKLDAIGAVGVARAIAYAVRAGHPAFAVPSQSFINTGQLEPGEPHSAYHEYLFKLRKLKSSLSTATGIRLAESRHQVMQSYFESLDSEMRGEI